VPVDFELHGCPINKHQLLEVISAYLHRPKSAISPHSVCMECKLRGTVCVMVAQGIPCLGPVTHAGCGAICPAYNRGCYGCYGPKEAPNTISLSTRWKQPAVSEQGLLRAYRTFNTYAGPFRQESKAHEP
jgi:sulfhydrogenase subunit delta